LRRAGIPLPPGEQKLLDLSKMLPAPAHVCPAPPALSHAILSPQGISGQKLTSDFECADPEGRAVCEESVKNKRNSEESPDAWALNLDLGDRFVLA
jgi:hypothetical protein